jgi:hypothetical protein
MSMDEKLIQLVAKFIQYFPNLSRVLIVIITKCRLDFIGRYVVSSKIYKYNVFTTIFNIDKLNELAEFKELQSIHFIDHESIRRTTDIEAPQPYTTGRFIYMQSMEKTIKFQEYYGVKKLNDDFIHKELYPKIKTNIYYGGNLETEFEKDLQEEYIHHMMIVSTPVLMLWNLCSYIVRLNLLYLTDRMRNLYGFPPSENLMSLCNKIDDFDLSLWKNDVRSKKSFKEAQIHRLWSYSIASSVAPILEGLSLILTGESVERYRFVDVPLYSKTKQVIERVKNSKVFNQITSDKKLFSESIINLGRLVLNAPLSIYQKHNTTSREEAIQNSYLFQDYFFSRFLSIMSQIDEHGLEVVGKPIDYEIDTADPDESSFLRMFDYLLRKKGHYPEVRRLFFQLNIERFEIINVFAKLSSDSYNEPALMYADSESGLSLYDPEVYKGKRKWGVPGFEDFWGEDRVIIFFNKMILDAFFESDKGYWRDELKQIVKERWPDKRNIIMSWLDELIKRSYIWDTALKYNSDDEMFDQWFRIHVDNYSHMLKLARDLEIIEEVRMLAILGYIMGHR